jgi:Cu/Ag efflux pump CusA
MVRSTITWARARRLAVGAVLAVAVFAALAWFLHPYVAALIGSPPVAALLTPAPPAVVSVAADWPGSSAEEVERQLTIPLEITLAGMPGLEATYSRSLEGFACLDCVFARGVEYWPARQEVVNRLQFVRNLPPEVSPVLLPSPSMAHVVLRYSVSNPGSNPGPGAYTIGDLDALEGWVMERGFRRVAGVQDVASAGGVDLRYEIRPDPDRLRRFGITLRQLEEAVAGNIGDGLRPNPLGPAVHGIGPLGKAVAMKSPAEAAAFLRAEERRHLREIGAVVVASVNNVPVRVEDLVQGGPLAPGADNDRAGVVVGQVRRLGRVRISRLQRDERGGPRPGAEGQWAWVVDPDAVQGTVLMRRDFDAPGHHPDPADKLAEFNAPGGSLLPGVRLLAYPEPETGFTVHGLFPAAMSPAQLDDAVARAHVVFMSLPGAEFVASQRGRGDWVGSRLLPNEAEFFVSLKGAGPTDDLLQKVRTELGRHLAGVPWRRADPGEQDALAPFTAGGGECLVKIHGPDLAELEGLAAKVKERLTHVPGVGGDVFVYPIMGRPTPTFVVDRGKCQRAGVQVADVSAVLALAYRGKTISRLVEGEQVFDVVLCWGSRDPPELERVLNLPVDTAPLGGPALRLRDLVSPRGVGGQLDERAPLVQPAPACIYRQNGERVIPVRFSVTGAAGALAQAQAATADVFRNPYHADWSGP